MLHAPGSRLTHGLHVNVCTTQRGFAATRPYRVVTVPVCQRSTRGYVYAETAQAQHPELQKIKSHILADGVREINYVCISCGWVDG